MEAVSPTGESVACWTLRVVVAQVLDGDAADAAVGDFLDEAMPLLQTGRNCISALLISNGVGSGTARPYNSTGAYFVVGNSTATHAGSQTWLQGASSTMKSMDATYPFRATNVITFPATFSTAEANFAWNEWGIFNSTAAASRMLNRKVQALGTKTSAAQWTFTATLTLS